MVALEGGHMTVTDETMDKYVVPFLRPNGKDEILE